MVDSATVTAVESHPEILATKMFKNGSSVKGTFSGGVSDTVTTTISDTVSTSDSITIGEKISFKAEVAGVGPSAEESFSYTHSWGESKTETSSVAIGSNDNVSVVLDPGQSVDAQLSASRGIVKVRIVYKAYLIGDVAINYGNKYKDHHFWALDVGEVMNSGGIPNIKTITDDIEISFFANSQVSIADASGQMVRLSSVTAKAA